MKANMKWNHISALGDLQKAMFFDLDDTLLNSSKEVSSYTRQTLFQVRKKGYLLGIASGRSVPSVRCIIEKNGLDRLMDAACANDGASYWNIRYDRQESYARISRKDMEELMARWGGREDMILYYHTDKVLYTSGWDEQLETIRRQNGEERIADLRSVKDPELPVRMTILFLSEEAYHAFPGVYGKDIRGVRTGTRFYDIVAREINKAETVRKIMREYGSELKHVLFFGDSDNDVELIRSCGIGVAMKNADKKVKDAADLITEYDNDYDGVARFLDQYLFEERI